MNISKPALLNRAKLPKLTRKKLVLFFGTIVIVGLSVGGYFMYRRYQFNKTHVVVDGQVYKASFLTTSLPREEEFKAVPKDEQIKELEGKIASGQGTYQNYLALAQHYMADGNYEKAKVYYEHTRRTLNPQESEDAEIIKSLDEKIEYLMQKIDEKQ
jgi:cytochrome c-type biogenesis protein CcmH/NrfG